MRIVVRIKLISLVLRERQKSLPKGGSGKHHHGKVSRHGTHTVARHATRNVSNFLWLLYIPMNESKRGRKQKRGERERNGQSREKERERRRGDKEKEKESLVSCQQLFVLVSSSRVSWIRTEHHSWHINYRKSHKASTHNALYLHCLSSLPSLPSIISTQRQCFINSIPL